MWQSTQDKNENGSVMTQKETKWSVHLEVMETQEYLCDIHTKKMETHMCDINTKIIEAHRIFTQKIHTKNVGQFHSENEAKRCGSPRKMRIIYEIKRNKEVCSFRENERALCDSHTKLSGTVPLEN